MSTHDAKIHGQAHFYCERTRSELVAERDAARAEVTQLQVEARTSRAVEQSLQRQVAEWREIAAGQGALHGADVAAMLSRAVRAESLLVNAGIRRHNRDAWAKRWKAAAQKLWRARH